MVGRPKVPVAGVLLRITSFKFLSLILIVLLPHLRDFTSSPTPDSLKLIVNANHGGATFEVPADNP